MQIREITEIQFSKYGRIVENVDFSKLQQALLAIKIPTDVVYEPSVRELEDSVTAASKSVLFGDMPIEIGYCAGHNRRLNAVEYHRNSEINVAATDSILLLGMQQDIIKGFQYDTANMEAFLVPAGCAVELYATTLHYAPCQIDENGFMMGIILPKGTNYPLDRKLQDGEDALLAARNKWLIGHPDAELPEGTHLGLLGENIEV